MLQGLIAKKTIDIILKQVMKKREINKLRKYVEEDNELDIKVRKIEKRIKKLEKNSHPKADWICTDCGCKAQRVVKHKSIKLRKKKAGK